MRPPPTVPPRRSTVIAPGDRVEEPPCGRPPPRPVARMGAVPPRGVPSRGGSISARGIPPRPGRLPSVPSTESAGEESSSSPPIRTIPSQQTLPGLPAANRPAVPARPASRTLATPASEPALGPPPAVRSGAGLVSSAAASSEEEKSRRGPLFADSSLGRGGGKANSVAQKRLAKRELVSVSTEQMLESSILDGESELAGRLRPDGSEVTALQAEVEREFELLDEAFTNFRAALRRLAEDVHRLDITEHIRFIRNNQMLGEKFVAISRMPSASAEDVTMAKAMSVFADILAALNSIEPNRKADEELQAVLLDRLERDVGKAVRTLKAKLARDRERYDKAVGKVAGLRGKDTAKASAMLQAAKELAQCRTAYEESLHEARVMVLDVEAKASCDFQDILVQYFVRRSTEFKRQDACIREFHGYFEELIQWTHKEMEFCRESQAIRQNEQVQELDRDKMAQGQYLLRLLEEPTIWESLIRVLPGGSSLTRPSACSDSSFASLLAYIKQYYVNIADILIQQQSRQLLYELASAIGRLEKGRHEDDFVKS